MITELPSNAYDKLAAKAAYICECHGIEIQETVTPSNNIRTRYTWNPKADNWTQLSRGVHTLSLVRGDKGLKVMLCLTHTKQSVRVYKYECGEREYLSPDGMDMGIKEAGEWVTMNRRDVTLEHVSGGIDSTKVEEMDAVAFFAKHFKLNTHQPALTEFERWLVEYITDHWDTSDWTYDLRSGDRLTEAYENALGGTSCMTGDDSRFTELYANNPERVKLCVFFNGSGDDVGRCLLWFKEDGTVLHDRIYPTTNNWIGATIRKKLEADYPGIEHAQHDPDGHVIALKLGDCSYVPYLDSFRRAHHDASNDMLYVSTGRGSWKRYLKEKEWKESDFYDFDADNTEGGPLCDDNRVCCDHCGNPMDDGDQNLGPNDTTICDSCAESTCTCCLSNRTIWDDDSVECHDGEGNSLGYALGTRCAYSEEYDMWFDTIDHLEEYELANAEEGEETEDAEEETTLEPELPTPAPVQRIHDEHFIAGPVPADWSWRPWPPA